MTGRREFLATVGALALRPHVRNAGRSPSPDDADGVALARDFAAVGAEVLPGTPRPDGFRLPAEWAPHVRTVMAFPSGGYWRSGRLAEAQREWAQVARAVRTFEPVTMFANARHLKLARELCGADIDVLAQPSNSAWTRDTGPLVVRDAKGRRRAVGFDFNAWGGKDPDFAEDRLLKARIARQLGLGIHAAPLVLEGGAITVDGEGTLIAVEACILNENRNPKLDRSAVERIFGDYLGIERCVWLARGLEPDPITDGHVDGLCVFVRPGVVMLQTTEDRADPNFAICQDARRRLEAARDARGRALEVIALPMTADEVLHVNFYVCNGGVIVPVAGDPAQDDVPLAVIRGSFPDRLIVPVSVKAVTEGGGGIHCITQQVPAGSA